MRIRDNFHIYALTTSLFWSLAYVLTRICTRYVAPIYVASLRCLVAALTLLVIAVLAKLPAPKKKDIKWFVLSGLSGVFFYMLCFNKGCSTVTTATGNVMLAVSPLITAIGARIFFKEKLKRRQWAAIVICFAGVVVLSVLGGGFSVNAGLAWLLAGVLFISTFNLIQKYLSRSYPVLSITAYSFFFGSVGMLVFAPRAVSQTSTAPVGVWLLILLLGVGCSAVAYCSWTMAFAKAPKASLVSNYMFLNPFISAFLGWLMIGDPIEKSAVFGGAIIMIGLLLFQIDPAGHKKARE